MDVRKILEAVSAGAMSASDAEQMLKNLPYEDLGYAKLDLHRKLRNGFPETIYCPGKPDAYLPQIFETLYRENGEVLGTRATEHQYGLVREKVPDITWDPVSRLLRLEKEDKKRAGLVAVCTGGTADIPVAEEAAGVAEFFGCNVERFYDVGVAGIHRLLSKREQIAKANCVIAIAGMEGALGTAVAGLVENPVIAVPTSVGYGASFHGLSALLTMINSCANGISVVNIDNGYGAAYLAAQINRMAVRRDEHE